MFAGRRVRICLFMFMFVSWFGEQETLIITPDHVTAGLVLPVVGADIQQVEDRLNELLAASINFFWCLCSRF